MASKFLAYASFWGFAEGPGPVQFFIHPSVLVEQERLMPTLSHWP